MPIRLLALFASLSVGMVPALGDELKEARAAYGKADLALNKLWATLEAKLAAEQFAELQAKQRAWLDYRDYVADFQMEAGTQGDPAKRMADVGYLEAATGMTEARVAFLASWKGAAPDNRTGVWGDSYGGAIEIVERDAKLYFRIGCVRGPTFHVGGISGVAETNGDLAQFTDRDSAPDKSPEDGETWLHFHQLGDGTLKVAGANTGYYHGARAYFDGEYRRTGGLDEEARADVIRSATSPEGG